MADEKKQNKSGSKKKDEEAKPFVPQTAAELQKMQYERLMRDPERNVHIPETKKEWKPSDPKDFVRFVMGSSAGAGSGEFHVYRATRRREYNRQEYIEKKSKEDEIQNEYHKKLEQNAKIAEEKTAKKRAKRQKKKQKKQVAKKIKQTAAKGNEQEEEKFEEKDDNSEEEEEEPHFVIKGR